MIRFLLMAVMSLVLLVPAVQAQKKSIDRLICNVGTITMLLASKEATVFAIEQKGLNTKTGVTQYCVGVISIIAGKYTGNGFCKNENQKGEINISEFTVSKTGEGTYKYIYGTGVYKGITGGGKYKRVTRGKPIAKGTYQSCTKSTGTSEVPK